MKKIPTPVLLLPIAGMLLIAGIAHLVTPGKFIEMMPNSIPYKHFLVALSGWVEIALGVGLFIPPVRHIAAILILAMLIVYIPIHVVDLFRDQPVIGSKVAAWIRLPLQLVLMGMTWTLFARFVEARK